MGYVSKGYARMIILYVKYTFLFIFTAGSALQLPRNPLHFPSAPQSVFSSSSPAMEEEEDSDGPDFSSNNIALAPMTFHVMASGSPINIRASRQGVLSPISRGAPPSKIKTFFDELVNMRANRDRESMTAQPHRPRIIYVREPDPLIGIFAGATIGGVIPKTIVMELVTGEVGRSIGPCRL